MCYYVMKCSTARLAFHYYSDYDCYYYCCISTCMLSVVGEPDDMIPMNYGPYVACFLPSNN